MVGFDAEQHLEKALPVLRGMSKHIFIMGALGAGHVMKTLNNYCGAEALVAVCDALVVGQKFGLDPETMLKVLKVGTGQNFTSTYSLSEPVHSAPTDIPVWMED
jgi:3-hydroxyisobutyrate dehydrogenase-like beta-hydroxyacid dehydrogenase